MNKTAPSFSRILTMVVFALSCFGLLLFLWLSFGGPIPLKPQGYRFQVAFPEAPTLGIEADVRTAGVSVGKVRRKQLEQGQNRTLVDIELDSRFAPVASDARVILRQKTLLGETYVEITPGSSPQKIEEGGRLPDGRVAPAVELDEIFQALDPQTRDAFRVWQQDLAKGIKGRGQDFSDALGTLPGFAKDGSDILEVLDTHERAVSRLVKNTGSVFGALTENEAQLRNLITGSADLFEATGRQQEKLAETISIFPTFLDESKATLARLKTFSVNAEPLARDLVPVARDLGPTLRDIRAFAPDLEQVFKDLDPLITVSKKGLPATKEVLQALKPMLGELGPFLSNLNPMLEYLEAAQFQVNDFFWAGPPAVADTTSSRSGGLGHYLRQLGPTGSESGAIFTSRLSSNRGNSYFMPGDGLPYDPAAANEYRIQPQWDCKPTGGPVKATDSMKGCFTKPNLNFQGRLQGRFPHVERADYSKK